MEVRRGEHNGKAHAAATTFLGSVLTQLGDHPRVERDLTGRTKREAKKKQRRRGKRMGRGEGKKLTRSGNSGSVLLCKTKNLPSYPVKSERKVRSGAELKKFLGSKLTYSQTLFRREGGAGSSGFLKDLNSEGKISDY